MDEATFENLAEMMAFPEEELAQMTSSTACCLLASRSHVSVFVSSIVRPRLPSED